MTPIYLSADNPRWIPSTEADLQAAIDAGLRRSGGLGLIVRFGRLGWG
jgi:hypothetical protein